MTRIEAETIVAPHVFQMFPGQAVTHLEAKSLLGDERFARLLADPIRRWGPTKTTVYPWNVVDYVHQPDLRKDSRMPDVIQCPECKGEKKRIGVFPVYADHVPSSERELAIEFDCDRCNGTGSVQAAMLDWIGQGKSLREARRHAGIGLRKFCVSHGIDPLVRCNRERGVIDPSSEDVPFDWNTP